MTVVKPEHPYNAVQAGQDLADDAILPLITCHARGHHWIAEASGVGGFTHAPGALSVRCPNCQRRPLLPEALLD